ncbi:hypothetical protein NEPTK9_000188 [Candidatus Neptunochlamydia vexilliferae]|uniref:Uncharacterized protein n=1 Tax=Candidatus Neptunichlamydia vexilliferae TaxID=1651774 RepID=A0ABS0AXK6_9BACT|nr:hypothetical protein [Candidatus Neptunochlamydia vexilliferae]
MNGHGFEAGGGEKPCRELSAASRWLCKIGMKEGWISASHGPPRKVDLACQIEAQGAAGAPAPTGLYMDKWIFQLVNFLNFLLHKPSIN